MGPVDPEVVDALWAQIEAEVFITRAQFAHGLEEWDVEPVRVDGRLAFVALTKDQEFHYTSFDTGVPITRAMIWSRLSPIIARYGFVTTRTPRVDADRQHRLNRALGFKPCGGDEFFLDYRLERTCR